MHLFFLFFLNFTLFYFTILYWFCYTLTWISHGCTWIPNPEPPSHLPRHIISLDHPRAPAPGILYPALSLDWWFVSYMISYTFQCHSPKSSHPLPLPQSPKDCPTFLFTGTFGGLPWWFRGYDFMIPMWETGLWPLAREVDPACCN